MEDETLKVCLVSFLSIQNKAFTKRWRV